MPSAPRSAPLHGGRWAAGLAALAILWGPCARGRAGEMQVTDQDRAFWSWRPLSTAAVPTAPTGMGASNPIDSFWLAALQAKGMTPAPEATRRVLIRRLCFDLTGLPPAPEAVAAFEADPRPDAYERLVDTLLASPRFGERWGRHWLDLARYADSAGFERDSDRPTAWRYRDWVLKAVNEDLPFDRFVQWQVAGDQVAPSMVDARIASAFVGLGPVVETDTKLPDELARYRYADLDDMVSTTAGAFLGLTVGCARCHDHKYDPIPTRDYYRLLCAFTPVERKELPLPAGAAPPGATAFAVHDLDAPPANFLLKRGDPSSPLEPVSPGFLSVLTHERTPADYLAAAGGRPRAALATWLVDVEHGAGALAARVAVNRMWQHHFGEGLVRTPSDFGAQGERPTHPELLEWLAGRLVRDGWRQKPLHRLMVTSRCYRQADRGNETPGAEDPENRLLSRRRPMRLEAEALRDAMLATAGTLNDSIGGPGVKPPVPAELHTAYNTFNPYPTNAVDDFSTRRRSVYLFTKRSLRPPFVEAFDGADPAASCPRRANTTVAPQSLVLMNDPLVRRRAEEFAERLRRRSHGADEAVALGFEVALGRPPTAPELEGSREFVRRQAIRRGAAGGEAIRLALADFCQTLFCLNEFAYID